MINIFRPITLPFMRIDTDQKESPYITENITS